MTESSQLEGRYQRVLPKVTKMGSIISHRIDYGGIGFLKGQQQMPHKNRLKQPLNLSYIFSSTGDFGVTITTACPEIDQPQIRKSAKIILIWPRQRNSNSTFTVQTVRTKAGKRDKAIHCFKTTKLQLCLGRTHPGNENVDENYIHCSHVRHHQQDRQPAARRKINEVGGRK